MDRDGSQHLFETMRACIQVEQEVFEGLYVLSGDIFLQMII